MPGDETRPRWLGRALWLLVFVPWTLFLLHAQIGQRVDLRNRALKDPHSADEQRLRELTAVTPADAVLLLAFTVPGDLAILDADREELARCRDRIAAIDGVLGAATPPSPDPGLALMTVALRADDDAATAERVVAAAIASAPPALRVLATGLPLIEARIGALVASERAHLVPLLVLALLAAATAHYRHLGVALGALLPALVAIAWTGGLVALLGHLLDPVAALLDPVLLTIGVASSVHWIEAFHRGRQLGLDARQASRHASREQHQPAFLAAATTMVGLLALCTSSIPAVIDFGVRAALGVALVHAFTFLLLPAWLPFAARNAGARARPPSTGDVATSWIRRLLARRTSLLAATTALTVLAIAGLPRLRADNDPLRLLPAHDPCRAAHDELATRLGGVETFHLLGQRPVGDESSRLLPFVAALQAVPGVAGLAGPAVTNSEGAIAVPLLLRPGGSAVRVRLFAEVDRAARVLGLEPLSAAGPAVQIARDSATLMQCLLGSLWLTLAVLFAGIWAGLRSFRVACMGFVPSLLPCLWIYGAIGWADRPVSVATAMIGCTMLGLIVDNSLHLLHHHRVAVAAGSTRPVADALRATGRGMVFASTLLVLGFLVTSASNLATTVEFSLLASSTIAAALFGTAVVLPLLLAGTKGGSERAV